MRTPLVAFALGILFALGLGLGGMLQPLRVQGFLDVFSSWDPTLAFVMGGAVIVSALAVRLATRLRKPALAQTFRWPDASEISGPLVVGAALFGIGWGLSGLCPGPAMASLASLDPDVFAFVGAMLGGMGLHALYERWRAKRVSE